MGMDINSFPNWVQKMHHDMVVQNPSRGKDFSQDRHNKSQALLAQQIKLMKLPAPQRDYKLAIEACGRKWEADMAWLHKRDGSPQHLGVFIEGQVHAIKHQRPKDCERDNVLGIVLNNWAIFKFTPSQVRDLVAVDSIAAWLKGSEAECLAALQRKPRFR